MSRSRVYQSGQEVEADSQIDSQRFRPSEMDQELEAKRPVNHGETLPFRTLYQDLFDPLEALKPGNRPRRGGLRMHSKQVNARTPQEKKRDIIQHYIDKWRTQTGNDFYPAMRLLLPDKDRYQLYGLKENVLAQRFIKILQIDPNSEDGQGLKQWKQVGSRFAGNFAARLAEVIAKRPSRVEPGDMTIAEVNEKLEKLAMSRQETDQLPIIEEFYRGMNADELKWLVKIILKQMHIGATEKTLLEIWHPDAERLFNVTSDLKRVCWDLWSKDIRLESENDCSITLGSCLIPQSAENPKCNLDRYPKLLECTDEDPEFYIEEKLDGERMQVHTWIQRTNIKNRDPVEGKEPEYEPEPPYRIFKFWSRKAKDYTYLYGQFLDGPNQVCALTRDFKDAIDEDSVDSAILDGEMIAWHPVADHILPFGSLKTAAGNVLANPFTTEQRPLFRVFDILYLNGKELIRYDLRTRRKVLERAIKTVHRRIEIVPIVIATTGQEIERELQKIVVAGTEGLVVKNPRARYLLNDRPKANWLKVKPEYMSEFGEELDCLIVGGYYGTGRRAGGLSSFMCGLRADSRTGEAPSQKFLSFFKVGGGFTFEDYQKLNHATEGKWHKYDPLKPPIDYIELAGGSRQFEKPDMWIRPEDSLVVQVKAASVAKSDEFAVGITLRFPRFSRWKDDKDWQTALTHQEFLEVKNTNEKKQQEAKSMQAQQRAEKNQTRNVKKKPVQIAGYTDLSINEAARASQKMDVDTTTVFRGLMVFVMTGSENPRKSKLELEDLVKVHGGRIIQTASPRAETNGHTPPVICIASKNSVSVASLMERGTTTILQPAWIFDCIEQAKTDSSKDLSEMLLQPEFDRHVYFAPESKHELYRAEVDQYGDSYARDTTINELRDCLAKMEAVPSSSKLDQRLTDFLDELPSGMFRRTVMLFFGSERNDILATARFEMTKSTAKFAGARVVDDLDDTTLTHVVLDVDVSKGRVRDLRSQIASRPRIPRFVTTQWIEDCWKEKTVVAEDRYVPL